MACLIPESALNISNHFRDSWSYWKYFN